jgi:hypothetical protein
MEMASGVMGQGVMRNIDMESNISDFLKNGLETLICSDYEGTMPLKQIEIFEDVFKNDYKQIIYLGDIFDNTSDCSKNYVNYCSLKMIKYLVDYPTKSRYVVGNRDINKIKLVPLLQLKSNVSWWAETAPITGWQQNTRPGKNGKWRKPPTPKNNMINMFTNIVSKLINDNVKDSTIWNVATMENYVPYWAKKTKDFSDNWLKAGATHVQPMTTLYERFVRIFGTDTSEGTMSANNIINGIPDELFKDNIKGLINDIKAQLNSNDVFKNYIDSKKNDKAFKLEEINKKRSEDKKGPKPPLTDDEIYETFSDLEIRSGIVFTIFMRMLDESLYKPNSRKDIEFNDINDIDGYLWKYLNMALPALYAKNDTNNVTNNELFLFSHGGVTNEFINIDSFDILRNIKQGQWERILHSTVKEQPTGIDTGKSEPMENIITKIKKYNKDYMEILTECFNTFKTSNFNTNLMILLTISAPAENNDLLRGDAKLASIEQGDLKYISSSYSPIQPKQPKASNLTYDGENTKIYNIWGHASVSFGYGFKQVTDKMYYISTDFSGSLYKDKICDKNDYKNYNDNNLILSITYLEGVKFNLTLKGEIIIDSKFIDNKTQPAKINDKDPSKSKPQINPIVENADINTILSSELEKYQVVVIDGRMVNIAENNKMKLIVNQNGYIDENFFHNDKKNIGTQLVNNSKNNKINKIKIDYNYNGEVNYNGVKYDLYSYYYFEFPKKRGMLVLNETTSIPVPTHQHTIPPSVSGEDISFGGYRKKRSGHKSKKNKMSKKNLYKKSTKNISKKNKKSKNKK